MAGKGGVFTGLDLSLMFTPNQEAARLATAQDRLLHLRLVLGGQIGDNPQLGPPVCVIFEGWDASGKGGAIKRLVAPLAESGSRKPRRIRADLRRVHKIMQGDGPWPPRKSALPAAGA